MTNDLDLRPVLVFVRSLRANNNRDWFEAHRPEFQAARLRFEGYVEALIAGLARSESLGILTPKDCIFRMHRDLRFSKDKTPYKPYMSAYVASGGRKSRRLGYYVHLEAGNHSILGGGLHEPEPHQLAAWRASIDRDSRPFRKILAASGFRKYFGELRGERLKGAPKGYPKDHPDLDLLQLKRVTVWREMPDARVVAPDLLRQTLATFAAMRPFLRYLQDLV